MKNKIKEVLPTLTKGGTEALNNNALAGGFVQAGLLAVSALWKLCKSIK
jgi:hypothetical protein